MKRVLVLEHYQPIRQALGRALRHVGWDARLAVTDREVLLALQRDTYDVLIVDLDAPTGDGWRVLEELAATYLPLPVVALLVADSSERERAKALGAGVILSKPIDRDTLLSGVQAALAHSHKTL